MISKVFKSTFVQLKSLPFKDDNYNGRKNAPKNLECPDSGVAGQGYFYRSSVA